jgi:hypothetical protein
MLDNVNDFVQTTIGNVPLAALTIVLLAAPTVLYVIYRLSAPAASHGRSRSSATPLAQWVCPQCHSVNDLSTGRCYRCAFVVSESTDVLVIDPVTAKPIPLATPPATFPVDRPAVAVGPGPAAPAAAPVLTSIPTSAPASPSPAPTSPAAAPAGPAVAPTTIPGAPGSPGVPVGPGRPVGAPVRAATSGSSVGTTVGARRPFDPPPADQGGSSGS